MKIVNNILKHRKTKTIDTTGELNKIIEASNKNDKKHVILIVDDEPDNLALLRNVEFYSETYLDCAAVSVKTGESAQLNPNIAHCIDNYMARADKLLTYLTATDPNGILTTTFTDGLLGQSLTFFAQAKQLAFQGD